jgi:hypothetical protein
MAKYSSKCVDFNGTTTYGTAGDVLDKTNLDAFSIVGWARSSDIAGDILSKLDGSSTGYSMRITSADLEFIRQDAGGGISLISADVPTHDVNYGLVWWFYGVTCTGGNAASTMSLYINGKPATSTEDTDTLTATTANAGVLTVAGINGAANFGAATVGAGALDGLAIYDGALSDAEMLALYNLREPSDYSLITTTPSLESHWRMGDDASDTSSLIIDVVGANDVTLTGVTDSDILEFVTAGGWPVTGATGVRSSGDVPDAQTFVMFGHDADCVDGVAPTTWEVTGAPDLAGAQAPALPCGGSWESIWVGQVK